VSSDYERRYRRWYSEDAPVYDTRFIGASDHERFAAEESAFIIDLLRPQPNTTILDVGTGTGRASLALAASSSSKVVGLDLTPAMLAQARAKRDAAGMHFPAFVCGNARHLPFRANTFDAVMSIRVLHLFPTPYLGAFVDEMRRVLKPGGTLLIEFDSPLAGFGWAVPREVLRRARGAKPRYYLWPQHAQTLFAGLEDVEAHGFWFPGIGRLAQHSNRFEWALRLARIGPPFGYVANKILVRARKPAVLSNAS
jgi:ubiquinone/menaquinone biosynthesis C-methylase UbiE